nr:MAG TPA: hypothetical protein [Caudoviricetes sp.]
MHIDIDGKILYPVNKPIQQVIKRMINPVVGHVARFTFNGNVVQILIPVTFSGKLVFGFLRSHVARQFIAIHFFFLSVWLVVNRLGGGGCGVNQVWCSVICSIVRELLICGFVGLVIYQFADMSTICNCKVVECVNESRFKNCP